MPISGTSSSGSAWNSESVEGDVQRYPDGVDKVPVQDRPFGAEVIAGREVAHESSNEDADQHQHADGHVQSVESGQAEEDAAVNARGDREVLGNDEVGVLVRLAAQEAGPQQDGDDQPAREGVAIIATNRIQRPVRGEAAADEQH